MAADDGDEAACRRLMDKPHGTYCPKVTAWKTLKARHQLAHVRFAQLGVKRKRPGESSLSFNDVCCRTVLQSPHGRNVERVSKSERARSGPAARDLRRAGPEEGEPKGSQLEMGVNGCRNALPSGIGRNPLLQ